MHKDLRDIVKQLRRNGYTIEQVKGGHYKVKNANGGTVYMLPSTPGGGRWKQNLEATLKRKGLI